MDYRYPKVINSLIVAAAKGGVGKTATATTVAAVAAERGLSALLVDIDPQASATRALSIDPAATGEGRSLNEALANGEPVRVHPSPGRENLWVVPGGGDIAEANEHLPARAVGAARWTKVLADEAERRDLIVIDCPPSVLGSRLGEVALCSSEFLVSPCSGSLEDIEGLLGIGDVTGELKAQIAPLGVALMRMPATATRRRAEAISAINDILGDFAPLFPTVVRSAEAAVNEAVKRGLLFHEYGRTVRPGRHGVPANAAVFAAELTSLAEEVLTAFCSAVDRRRPQGRAA